MSNDYEGVVTDYFANRDVTESDAWQHIYKLLWNKRDRIHKLGASRELTVENVPTVKEDSTIKGFKWMERADRAREYLVDHLGDAYDDEFDLLYQEVDSDRQNTRGNGFEHATAYLIESLCGVSPMVGPKLSGSDHPPMQGYEMVEGGDVGELDLALFSPAEFRMVISTKWTLRRDRLKQYFLESQFLKERTPDLNMTVLTNDCDENFLTTMIENPHIDRVYHVHKPLVMEIIQPYDGESGTLPELVADGYKDENRMAYRYLKLYNELYDLTDLIQDINDMVDART